MSLLDVVRWPALYRKAYGTADQRTRSIAAGADTIHDAFAHLVAGEHYIELRVLVADHSPLGLDDAERVGRWLEITGHVIVADLARDACPPPAPLRPRDGLLQVDPELCDLPLLPLLTAFAGLVGGFRVLVRELPGNVSGRASFRCIELDPATPASELHRVWRHELGHTFDPWTRPTPEQREDYADEMGELLAAHQPTTLVQLVELVNRAHEAVTGDPRHQAAPEDGLPAAGAESLAAFRALPLLDAPRVKVRLPRSEDPPSHPFAYPPATEFSRRVTP